MLPKCPLPLTESKGVEKFVEWDNWARNQLMSAGSDLLGKFANLQVLLLIILLLFFYLNCFLLELFSYKKSQILIKMC